MKDAILVVDDEAGVRGSLSGILGDEGYLVSAVGSGEAALEAIEASRFDLVLLDVWLPGLDGLEVLRRIREGHAELPVVVISGHGTIETAVKAVRLGAQDFVEKPLSLEKTVLAVKNALRQRRLESQLLELRQQLDARYLMVGESPALQRLREEIRQAAPSNGRVLIFGENGTGKELVARQVHAQSQRAAAPFVEVNCAAIPEELIESELFGHTKGAFTGALAARKGKFELADGGTLFLDEIGDMSLKTQAKVLRALQEQRIEPVGGSASVDVDVRVIAATNKDLEAEIRAGRFREDLYFRLNVIPFEVPPLRERREDIPLLVRHFMQLLSAEHGRRAREVSEDALEALALLAWPGNVRELRNMVERLVIMAPGDVITAEDLPAPLRPKEAAAHAGEARDRSLKDARDNFERAYILAELRANDWNVTRTAERLGIERSHLYRKLKAYSINPPKRDS
jgi:two-component system, NtrC family, nitrogen regulation response regulator NtrX